MKYKAFTYNPIPKTAWDNLSMLEKSEMMKIAVKNGITDLKTIREKYNEFAEGGDINEERPAIIPFGQKTEVIITPDSEYNQYLNTLPDNQRFTPNDKYDSYLYWKLHGKPKNFEEAYNRDMFHYDNSDSAYHANSIAWGDDGVGYFMKPKTHDTVGYELDWFNKGLVTEEGGHQRSETPDEKLEADEFRKNYMLIDDPVRTNYYRYQPIERAKGGKIHIKPENRGKFTALKERTGHSATWFKEHGTPAQKKMAVFALNARKWKHGLGGNLFDGTSEDTQQMQIGRPYYSYDWNGNRMTDADGNPILNYNVSLPEVTIVPDSRLSPAERNYRERQRQKTFTDYAEQNSRDYITRQSVAAQKQWENSLQKKALDLGIAAAQGIGMASDVVSPFLGGIPVYSGLKGAQALDRATNTNELGDYADAALWLSPMLTVAGKRIYDTAKPVISEVYNRLVDNGTLWDAYTTFGGRFGNYGDNVFTNMYGTTARRFGLPDKARVPADGIRKIKEDPRISNGMVDFTGDKNWYGNPHVNATIDRGVVSHPDGGWDGADTYLFPFRDFLAETKGSLKSIEPSDVFSNGVAFMESPSKVTLISGDATALENAKKVGMQTLSSPKLRRLYSEAEAKYNANKLLNRHPKKEQYWKEYADEVQRLQSQRGVPTLDDFRLLEQTTGLKAGIAPLSEYENAIRGITEMQKTMYKPGGIRAIMSGEAVPYTYPNGREVDWTIQGVADELNALQRAKYNNVFYDPTTYIESIWRSGKEPKW